MMALLGAARVFGTDHGSLQYVLDDSKSALAQFVSCNAAVRAVKMPNQKHQAIAAAGLFGFGLWGATKMLMDSTQPSKEKEEDFDVSMDESNVVMAG